MKTIRLLQFITGVHKIHHIYYSYGWKLPLLPIAIFKKYGIKYIEDKYHDCTITGKY